MKLVIAHYLASLKERGELDAILPDLLSEIGFEVLSRPQTGTRQAGVDVAAVGPDPDNGGTRTLFLFTIKSGNLTRSEWDSGPQSVRQSINDILDNYIPHRVPEQFAELPVAICLGIGGEMREQVNESWQGFTNRQQTDRIRFRIWNGDRIAQYLLDGVLRQEFIDGEHRGTFQKALAMLDQPDVSYRHFNDLIAALLAPVDDPRQGTRHLRQAYICLWVLFVWARDEGNLDAAFRASELMLIRGWGECDPTRINDSKLRAERFAIFDQLLRLHILVSETFLFEKLAPLADKTLALSFAVDARAPVDVNLALFETLGRVAMHGIWMDELHLSAETDDLRDASAVRRDETLDLAITILNRNPALLSPARDDFAIEIALLMILAQRCGRVGDVAGYITGVSDRLGYTLRSRRHYPVASMDYRDLLDRDNGQDDEVLEEKTRGSILYPLLMTWLIRIGERSRSDALATVLADVLLHTTHQVWFPCEDTDALIWKGQRDHGIAVPSIPLNDGPEAIEAVLIRACEDHAAVSSIGAVRAGFLPVLLCALRHHRLPVPPQLWFVLEEREDEPMVQAGVPDV